MAIDTLDQAFNQAAEEAAALQSTEPTSDNPETTATEQPAPAAVSEPVQDSLPVEPEPEQAAPEDNISVEDLLARLESEESAGKDFGETIDETTIPDGELGKTYKQMQAHFTRQNQRRAEERKKEKEEHQQMMSNLQQQLQQVQQYASQMQQAQQEGYEDFGAGEGEQPPPQVNEALQKMYAFQSKQSVDSMKAELERDPIIGKDIEVYVQKVMTNAGVDPEIRRALGAISPDHHGRFARHLIAAEVLNDLPNILNRYFRSRLQQEVEKTKQLRSESEKKKKMSTPPRSTPASSKKAVEYGSYAEAADAAVADFYSGKLKVPK